MSRNPRLWVLLLFVATGSIFLVGFVRDQALNGWVGIRVQDHDTRFAIRLPAALARVAVSFVPDDVWRDAGQDLGEWGPAVQSALGELEDCDDAVLVQVESEDETVYVRKVGERFQITVWTPEEQVELQIPTRLVRAVWDRMSEPTDQIPLIAVKPE